MPSLSNRLKTRLSQRHHQPPTLSLVPSPARLGLGCTVNACTFSVNGFLLSLYNCGIRPPSGYRTLSMPSSLYNWTSTLSTENITYTVCASIGRSSPSGFLIGKKRPFSNSFPYASTNLIIPGSITPCVTLIS